MSEGTTRSDTTCGPRVGPDVRASGRLLGAVALLGLWLAAAPASAQLRGGLDADGPPPERPVPSQGPVYRVRPVDGAPTAPGVRRTIEAFGGWTLICDEEGRRRVCNASQSIVGADGDLAFSWSLAATKGGEPVFLLRAPVGGFPARTVGLDFGGGETPIRLDRCEARLCLGFLPLDGEIVRRVRAGGGVGIRYRTGEGAVPVTLRASLDGLARAIGSIR